jgi:hypothetical protein
MAVLEVLREQREAEQESEQVREDHPLVRQVAHEPVDTGAFAKAGERELVRNDDEEPDQRDLQRVVMKSAMPTRIAANKRKSTGTPSTDGRT